MAPRAIGSLILGQEHYDGREPLLRRNVPGMRELDAHEKVVARARGGLDHPRIRIAGELGHVAALARSDSNSRRQRRGIRGLNRSERSAAVLVGKGKGIALGAVTVHE